MSDPINRDRPPTATEWEEWLAHPTTAWFQKVFLRDEHRRTRSEFARGAWDHGWDEVAHAGHKMRADTLAWVALLTHADVQQCLKAQETKDDEG